jgi:hypothetical protein
MSVFLSAITEAKRSLYIQRLCRNLLPACTSQRNYPCGHQRMLADDVAIGRFNIYICNFSMVGSIDMKLLMEGKADLEDAAEPQPRVVSKHHSAASRDRQDLFFTYSD